VQLRPFFRYSIYAVLTVLVVTGVAWLIANQFKSSANGELWQAAAANLLMPHGGAATISLLLIGALFPVHIRMSWMRGKNRLTGGLMVSIGAVLIATAFGLYYTGSDLLRPWISWTHIGFGLAVPLLALVHIVTGRRSR